MRKIIITVGLMFVSVLIIAVQQSGSPHQPAASAAPAAARHTTNSSSQNKLDLPRLKQVEHFGNMGEFDFAVSVRIKEGDNLAPKRDQHLGFTKAINRENLSHAF